MKPPHSRGPGGSARPPSDPSARPHTKRGPARGPGGTASHGSAPSRSGAPSRDFGPNRSGGSAAPEGRDRKFAGEPRGTRSEPRGGSDAKSDGAKSFGAKSFGAKSYGAKSHGTKSHGGGPPGGARGDNGPRSEIRTDDRTRGSARGQIVHHDKQRGDRVLGQHPAHPARRDERPAPIRKSHTGAPLSIPPGAPAPAAPDPPAETAFARPQSRSDASRSRPDSPDHPRGTVWLYGHHAIAAALANPARRLRRLLLTEEAEATLAGRLAPPWAIAHERVPRARLDQLLGRDIVHQGAALLADPLATPGLAQTMERPGPILVLDQVSDPRNVGAILRSAAAFGVAAVITQDRNAPDESGALAKAASGALELVPLLRAVNIARTLVALKAAGAWVIGLDGNAPGPLSGAALAGRRVVLVLGAEGDGLRRLTRETCDELAGLAMPGLEGKPGGMESLNVSAATAIALYELTKTS